jgi:hypothetical protein
MRDLLQDTARQSSPVWLTQVKKSRRSCAYAWTVFGDADTCR